MKAITGLLVGAGMLVSSVGEAQVYGQASVSGLVLSNGPIGFMLQGPDGNYGIVVTPGTAYTDPWNNSVTVGPGNVWPGTYVTATGYPLSQWTMRASVVVLQNASLPVYGGGYTTIQVPSTGVFGVNTFFRTPPSATSLIPAGISVNRPFNASVAGLFPMPLMSSRR
jgi:hypothetical protein